MDIYLTEGDDARGRIRLDKEVRVAAADPLAAALPVPENPGNPPSPTPVPSPVPVPVRPSSLRWFGAIMPLCTMVGAAVLYEQQHPDDLRTTEQAASPKALPADPHPAAPTSPSFSPAPLAASPAPVSTPVPVGQAAQGFVASKGAIATPSWIVSLAAFEDAAQADAFIVRAELEGHGPLSRLWIPDWPSLSGRPFFAVYAGPYSYDDRGDIRRKVDEARAWAAGAYAVKLDLVPGREELR